MFKIKPNPTFRARVPMPVPGVPEADRPKVEFEFRHKTKTEVAAFIEHCKANPDADVDSLMQIIVGWSGVVDEDGVPIAFSRDQLAALAENYLSAPVAIASAYQMELAAAKTGN